MKFVIFSSHYCMLPHQRPCCNVSAGLAGYEPLQQAAGEADPAREQPHNQQQHPPSPAAEAASQGPATASPRFPVWPERLPDVLPLTGVALRVQLAQQQDFSQAYAQPLMLAGRQVQPSSQRQQQQQVTQQGGAAGQKQGGERERRGFTALELWNCLPLTLAMQVGGHTVQQLVPHRVVVVATVQQPCHAAHCCQQAAIGRNHAQLHTCMTCSVCLPHVWWFTGGGHF